VLISANNWQQPYPVYPLGISYLASYIRQVLPEIEITLLDANQDEFSAETLLQLSPSLIGISLRNIDNVDSTNEKSFIEEYQLLINRIKAATSAPIILGGAGFSIYPHRLLQQFEVDYGVAGEGELALSAFIEAMISERPLHNIDGVICRNCQQSENKKRSYLSEPKLNFEQNLLPFYWQSSGMLNIQSKRGCPYQCVYCTYPNIDGRIVRNLPITQITDTLKSAYENHGVDYVFFTDSVFNIASKYNAKLADALINLDLPIKWGAYFSPHKLSLSQLQHYQASGLKHVEFGTESFSNSTLRAYNKPFDVEEVLQVSHYCEQLSIYYAHFLIVGGIGENEASLQETLDNTQHIQNGVLFPYFGMRIYPNTILQHKAIEQKVIGGNEPLLKPRYYINHNLDFAEFKRKAKSSKQAWVMPDDEKNELIEERLRAKGYKGPLWEYYL